MVESQFNPSFINAISNACNVVTIYHCSCGSIYLDEDYSNLYVSTSEYVGNTAGSKNVTLNVGYRVGDTEGGVFNNVALDNIIGNTCGYSIVKIDLSCIPIRSKICISNTYSDTNLNVQVAPDIYGHYHSNKSELKDNIIGICKLDDNEITDEPKPMTGNDYMGYIPESDSVLGYSEDTCLGIMDKCRYLHAFSKKSVPFRYNNLSRSIQYGYSNTYSIFYTDSYNKCRCTIPPNELPLIDTNLLCNHNDNYRIPGSYVNEMYTCISHSPAPPYECTYGNSIVVKVSCLIEVISDLVDNSNFKDGGN